MMRFFVILVFVITSGINFSPAYAIDDLPEPGMAPDYEPEDVVVPDETVVEETVEVNEPEIIEENRIESLEEEENSDYVTTETEIHEIQEEQKVITEDIN